MATLVFGMNQSLDGYVDHEAFAPAQTPAANSSDTRELGIRVFHVFVEPQA